MPRFQLDLLSPERLQVINRNKLQSQPAQAGFAIPDRGFSPMYLTVISGVDVI